MAQNKKQLKRNKILKKRKENTVKNAGEITVSERKMGRMQLYLVGIISLLACFFIFYSLNR